MEHRLSQRFSGDLPILLYKRGIPVATGEVRNASRCGLFIATEYDDVRLNQAVKLGFRLAGDYSGRLYSLNAHVVRVDGEGVGVDLDATGNDARTISELIIWFQDHSMAPVKAVRTVQYAH